MTPKYEINQATNDLNTALEPHKGTIVTDRKTKTYDEAQEDAWAQDTIMAQLKIPHKQDIPIKNIRAVDMRIRDQKNKIQMDKMKNEIMPKMKPEDKKEETKASRRKRKRFRR